MKYHKFKSQLAECIAKTLGERCRIMIQEVPQNNGIYKESMTIIQEEGIPVPAIELAPFYEAYLDGASMQSLAEAFLDQFQTYRMAEPVDIECFMDYRKACEYICYKLVHFEKNKELLEEIPHRRILDLAIIYYYRMEQFQDQMASILIRNEHLKIWGITESQLYQNASDNTCRLLPAKLSGIMQVIREMSENYNLELPTEGLDEGKQMYVLTNPERNYGAVCFLYPEVAQDIANFFSDNFYILPSSIHECIIVPDSGLFDSSELKHLVGEVNDQCVLEEEILSDNVYYYDRMQQKFCFASCCKGLQN